MNYTWKTNARFHGENIKHQPRIRRIIFWIMVVGFALGVVLVLLVNKEFNKSIN